MGRGVDEGVDVGLLAGDFEVLGGEPEAGQWRDGIEGVEESKQAACVLRAALVEIVLHEVEPEDRVVRGLGDFLGQGGGPAGAAGFPEECDLADSGGYCDIRRGADDGDGFVVAGVGFQEVDEAEEWGFPGDGGGLDRLLEGGDEFGAVGGRHRQGGEACEDEGDVVRSRGLDGAGCDTGGSAPRTSKTSGLGISSAGDAATRMAASGWRRSRRMTERFRLGGGEWH